MCGDEIATSSVTAQMVGGIPYNGLVKSKFVGLPTPLPQLVIDQFIGALTTAERRARSGLGSLRRCKSSEVGRSVQTRFLCAPLS